jgi:hypothetical protein
VSIIPNIPRPTIAPNRFAEIPFANSLFVDANTTIFGSGRFIRLFWANNNPVSIVQVDGTVWAALSGNVSGAIVGFNIDDIVVNGTVAAVADVATAEFGQANAYAISNAALGNFVTNNGTIYAFTNGGIAHALQHWGPDVLITNNGLIAAQTGTRTEAAASQALGIYMVNGGFVENRAGGRILAEGVNATGIIMGRGDFGPGAGARPNIINDGTIQAVSIAGAPSVGILIASLGVETMQIRNNGLIAADVAIRTGSATWPVSPSDATIVNGATGIIRGTIEGDLGSERVFNAGRIEGNLLLGDGSDLFDNAAGVHIGYASLGWGTDIFIGGAGAERVDGGRMDDNLSGGGGNDLLLGGMGADIISGGTGNDGLFGDYGDDVLLLQGGDRALGGHGDDRIELADLAFALVDGGAGRDTLATGALTGTINLGAVLSGNRVTGIETVDLGTTGRAAIAAANAVAALNGLRIDGSGTAALTLAGTWADAGQEVVGGFSYTRWRTGNTTISVRAGVSVTVAPALPADARGLDGVAGGAAAPVLADEPTFALANPVWNNARYFVYEDTTIGAYETWRVDGGQPLMTAFARDANVTNAGTLESTVGGRVVSVDILESFTNSGTIRAVSTLPEGSSLAFQANQEVPLFNSGTIYAEGIRRAEAVQTWTSGSFGQRIFENTGRIEAVSSAGSALAVSLAAGGSSVNAGDIIATGATRVNAVQLNLGGDIENSGRIEAIQTGAAPNELTTAILMTGLSRSTLVVNRGVIRGPVAINALDEFGSAFTTPLEIRNETGGQIIGDLRLAATRDRIVNRGTITGNVNLGAGDDVFDSRGGVFTGQTVGIQAGAISAGDGVDWIHAGAGNHSINGGSNVDTVSVSGRRADYTVTQLNTGVFRIVGPDGDDMLSGVEFLQFDDQTLRLRPGTGVSVNFNTADRTVYQSAMNNIRDFDGNALGGNGGWLRIGQADVNGDGDIDQILVNRTIGRFATVGTAPDGLVYFADHGWAGETRVGGIYVDPLVAIGLVQAGSPNDSQRRFQNDLQIENINRVLGANDYNRDGIQEVYFALTDGTAYLRALMHADGNIRYANYQSQQEVIDYLTANGFGQETWGSWFNRPSEGEVNLMQDRIDMAEASGLGRAHLTALDAPMPGSINPATLAFHAPALDDHMRAEFYG